MFGSPKSSFARSLPQPCLHPRHAVVRTPSGDPADQFSQHVETNFNPDSLQSFQKDGLNYGNDVIVPPGEYSVRFVVRNNVDGRMGSVMAPLRVAP